MNRWTCVVGASFLVVACGGAKPLSNTANAANAANAVTDVATTTHATTPVATQDVSVSGDIVRDCKIVFDNVDRAPRFDFDQSGLTSDDQSVLSQVARCVTVGPLKGHAIRLVGRADPRGEVEYNMSLGAHRADAAERYLKGLGVDTHRLTETSRGKLDAVGTDEAGWARDRRVDVDLI